MIQDKELIFSAAQAFTSQATVASTNVIDIKAAGDADDELFCVLQVETAATSSGSAILDIQLITSAAEAMTSPVLLNSTGALAYTNYTLGKEFKFRIARGMLRYLRVDYVLTGADLTAGKFNAFLTPAIDTNR